MSDTTYNTQDAQVIVAGISAINASMTIHLAPKHATEVVVIARGLAALLFGGAETTQQMMDCVAAVKAGWLLGNEHASFTGHG